MGVDGPCGVCQAATTQACGGCGSVHYCGKEHQRQHWPQHRAQCRPYKLISSPDAGRYAVASRNLAAGQTFMEEAPIVVGPKASRLLVCLGCHSAISQEEFPRCPQCFWPMCSSECSSSPLHASECRILASDAEHVATRGETPHYDIILLLRCLLLRSLDPQAWESLLDMAHHSEQRQLKEEAEQMYSVNYLTDVLKVDFDAEIVHRIQGAITTNVVELTSRPKLAAMYPKVRLLNSSCRPNVELLCGAGSVMQVRTALPIKAGEPLCFSYTGTMLPLWERQESLVSFYHFSCECPRCSDPTELGTYFSCPKCVHCKGSYLQPSNPSGEAVWSCSRCKREKSSSKIQAEAKDWLERIQMTDVLGKCSLKHMKDMLDEVAAEFHTQHYVWMRLAQVALRHLYYDDTEMALQLRSRIWQRLLFLHDVFEPGLTRRRGMTLLETGRLMLEAAQKEYEEGNPFIPEFISRLQYARSYLEESAVILDLEPQGSKMGAMAVRAKEKRVETESFLEHLQCRGLRAE